VLSYLSLKLNSRFIFSLKLFSRVLQNYRFKGCKKTFLVPRINAWLLKLVISHHSLLQEMNSNVLDKKKEWIIPLGKKLFKNWSLSKMSQKTYIKLLKSIIYKRIDFNKINRLNQYLSWFILLKTISID